MIIFIYSKIFKIFGIIFLFYFPRPSTARSLPCREVDPDDRIRLVEVDVRPGFRLAPDPVATLRRGVDKKGEGVGLQGKVSGIKRVGRPPSRSLASSHTSPAVIVEGNCHPNWGGSAKKG